MTTIPAGGAPVRVLLIDDDSFMLDVLSDMPGEIGQFDIRCETQSLPALGALVMHAPDLLICDLSMPDMDGIELLRAAAETGYQGGVVLLSGMHSSVRQAAERLAQAHGWHILGTCKKTDRGARFAGRDQSAIAWPERAAPQWRGVKTAMRRRSKTTRRKTPFAGVDLFWHKGMHDFPQ